MRMRRYILALSLLVVWCGARADYLIVSRNAQIKESPAADGRLIERASKGDYLELLANGKQTHGYYSVWAPGAAREGWIYRTLAKRYPGTSENVPAREAGSQEGFDGRHCGVHLKYGIPHKSDQILCRIGYAEGYNYRYKIPDWVSYDMTNQSANGINVSRSGTFRVDQDIPPEYRSGNSDYTGSGYDRGHMAPSASIDFSRKANDETFFYSNMTPQLPGFNRNMMGHSGVWGAIEDHERDWVRKRKELYIIAGTYVAASHKSIGHGVAVPTYFFKILYDPVTQESIAFWMPQDEDTAQRIGQYVTSIDYIEEQTGDDFFSTFDDDFQSLMESKTADYTKWDKGGGE